MPVSCGSVKTTVNSGCPWLAQEVVRNDSAMPCS